MTTAEITTHTNDCEVSRWGRALRGGGYAPPPACTCGAQPRVGTVTDVADAVLGALLLEGRWALTPRSIEDIATTIAPRLGQPIVMPIGRTRAEFEAAVTLGLSKLQRRGLAEPVNGGTFWRLRTTDATVESDALPSLEEGRWVLYLDDWVRVKRLAPDRTEPDRWQLDFADGRSAPAVHSRERFTTLGGEGVEQPELVLATREPDGEVRVNEQPPPEVEPAPGTITLSASAVAVLDSLRADGWGDEPFKRNAVAARMALDESGVWHGDVTDALVELIDAGFVNVVADGCLQLAGAIRPPEVPADVPVGPESGWQDLGRAEPEVEDARTPGPAPFDAVLELAVPLPAEGTIDDAIGLAQQVARLALRDLPAADDLDAVLDGRPYGRLQRVTLRTNSGALTVGSRGLRVVERMQLAEELRRLADELQATPPPALPEGTEDILEATAERLRQIAAVHGTSPDRMADVVARAEVEARGLAADNDPESPEKG